MPDPNFGVSFLRQAEYRAIAERIAWDNPRVVWFSQYLLRDDLPREDVPAAQRYSGFESGLRTASGRAKTALEAFPLPLAARRQGSRVSLWGLVRRAQAATTVERASTRPQARLPAAGDGADVGARLVAADDRLTGRAAATASSGGRRTGRRRRAPGCAPLSLRAGRRRGRVPRMAHHLWLLRHGEAEPHDARPDDERRLTDRGRQQSIAAGRALAALGLEFHHAFTSPKVRARDTARLACQAMECEPVEHEAAARRLRRRRRARAAGRRRRGQADPRRRPRSRLQPGRPRPDRRARRPEEGRRGRRRAWRAGRASSSRCCARASSSASAEAAPTMEACPSSPRSRSPRAAWTRRCAALRSSRRSRPASTR